MTQLTSILAGGYAAAEAEDRAGIEEAIAALKKAGVTDEDVRLGYLEFVLGWLDPALDEVAAEVLVANAAELVQSASSFADPADAARIVLDLADLLVEFDEIDDAEHALRTLSERDDLGKEANGEARLLHAQVLLDFHEDPDGALAVLDAVDDSLHVDPGYVSLRAGVLLELEREDEAVALLEQAIARDDDTQLRYQLGVLLRTVERDDDAIEHLLLVRARDVEQRGVDPAAEVDRDEADDLRRMLEDVLDTLPEPVLALVGTAAIRVERWPGEDAVREGCDPRTALAFVGVPATDERDAEVEALIIYRDSLIAQIELDEDIVDILALNLVEEVGRFADMDLFPG